MWTKNFEMYKLRSSCKHLLDHREKQGIFRKTSTSAWLTTLTLLTVWIMTNCGRFLKRWEYQVILPVSWETCMWVKKQQLEPDIEKLTGSKLGKEYVKAVYCHLAHLTSIQSTACEMPGWMKHSWNQDCWENCQQPRMCRWCHYIGRKQRVTKEPFDEREREEWKTQHSET